MRKIAFPVLAAVAGTIAVNALVFGTSTGAPVGPVSGVLYRDLNNNGRHEAGEPGVRNVVVASARRSTITNSRGEWSLDAEDGERLTVYTGWYRSQCDALSCKAGPGPDQDFEVRYQKITTKVSDGKRQFDVGLLPDWKGGYPIPSTTPIPANRRDISVRVSFVKASAEETNCNRTGTAAHRACQVGDRPTFLVQVYNEGIKPVYSTSGHLELPAGTRMLSLLPAPLTHPQLGEVTYGEMDPATRRIPFTVHGKLPPGAMSISVLSLVVEPDAQITTELQTKGSYPNLVGARITSVKHDTEDHRCLDNSLDCRWGTTNRQRWPDNSDTAGFAVVESAAPRLIQTLAAPLDTTAPATTAPATTAPATTAPATTAPATTAPATTAPATTAPATTAPAATAAPTTVCTVSRSGSTATIDWNPTGGTDVIRRDGTWLTTPSPGTGTYVDHDAPSGASYVIRTRTSSNVVDNLCSVQVLAAPAETQPTTVPPTTAPAPVNPPGSGCTVSDLLVPSCGIWLGASTPSRDGTYDYERGLAEYEGVAQNTPDILHFYHKDAQTFPNAKQIGMAERPGKQRSLLQFNWKPSTSHTWKQIADGAADDKIAKVAANLKKYPHKVFLNIYHEPEDNVKAAGSGMTADDYADMYRHVVDELRAHGVTNAVYVWNVMGYYGWRDYLDALYPGPNYVDWACYDPYAKNNIQQDVGDIVNRVRPDINWPGFYAWMTDKAPGKPIMLCEWGVDLLTNSDPASILKGDQASILAEYPMLKALVYWNDIDNVNARIDEKTTKGVALGQAYKAMAAQPIFNRIDPSIAP